MQTPLASLRRVTDHTGRHLPWGQRSTAQGTFSHLREGEAAMITTTEGIKEPGEEQKLEREATLR